MLRTIQSFALDRLAADGIETDVRRRHAEAYLALATQVSHQLNTSRHGEWLDRMAPEQANLRSAMRWSIDAGEGVLALRLAAALWRFWQAFGQVAEGRELAEQALAMPGGSDERIGPRLGAVRGREPRLLAGRLGDGAPPLPRRRSTSPRRRATRRASPTRTSTSAMSLFAARTTTRSVAAGVHRRGRGALSRPRRRARRGAGRLGPGDRRPMRGTATSTGADRASCAESLADFERLDDRQYHAMTDGEPRLGGVRRRRRGDRRPGSPSRRSSSRSRCATSARRRSRSTSGCCSAP